MIFWIFLFIVLPLLIVGIFTSIDSWLWRIILLTVAVLSIFINPFPGAPIVVPVVLIIGIAFKRSLSDSGL